MISVVIPVGPYESNKKWLRECLDSVTKQTIQAEIILIDDGAELLSLDWLGLSMPEYPDMRMQCSYLWREIEDANINGGCYYQDILYCRLPWRTGISHAFNYGISVASNELVVMLGSDDTLEPTCLERCVQAYNRVGNQSAYYALPIRYMDTREIQTAPCNAAMITKTFFKMIGGFPIESAVGMGDSALLSICIRHRLPVYWVGKIIGNEETPLYNYRRHPDIHTYKLTKFMNAIFEIRDILTKDWNRAEIEVWNNNYGL